MSKALVAYIPVIHAGYVRLLKKHRSEISALYLPGPELLRAVSDFPPEIRALDPMEIADLLRGSRYAPELHIEVMTPNRLPRLGGHTIIAPDELVSRRIVARCFPEVSVEYDDAFMLRWDEASISRTSPGGYDRITASEVDRHYMALAASNAQKSWDWWRQVGGVLVRNGRVVLEAFNHHVPSQLTPYVLGDPRDVTPAGVNPHISTALHCEQAILTEAARRGIATQGAQLYVTLFPCPMCAKQIAYAGIKTVYFQSGSASLDGQQVLNSKGVELVLVSANEKAAVQ